LGLPEGGEAAEEDAVALFTSTIQDSPEPVTVLALGPLTNVAAALEATPELADKIENMVVMGGAVDVDGSFVSDENTTAEWNIYSDPHAARLAFESGVPITLVPLDATNEVPVTPEFVEKLEAEKSTPAAEFVAQLLANNAESIASGSYYFWDPLVGTNAPPAEWMTTIETVEALGLPEGGAAAEEDAVTLFTSTIQDSPAPFTVLALGPLTNVASALEATPALVDNIAMMVVMGGAVDVDGSFVSDENTSAEWNIYSDPHAARLVFESGVPITLVPLDATNEVPVTPEFVAKLEAEKSTPAAEFVATLLGNNAESIASGSYYFWDPLAAVVLGSPDLVTLVPRDVTVVDVPGHPEDGRTKPVANGSEILVATAPDGEALEAALLEAWNR
ncbi:MAG: nucleoside hydrolase, partial [Chloroflexota bacterium]|nr:nucleoside hydrolase [Chloroflexota bacterium]